MKPIGVYVAARELPGRDVIGNGVDPAAVRTLRATDRLTGMPVLVHVLPAALPVPQLPDHPALLPYSDQGMDGDDAYLVTELPLHAVLAADPVLAARGALAGLAALHGAGLVHGGVSASQLWSVDGRVALAGAGLPWGAGPGSPDDDLRALADALAVLGGVPEPLRALRDTPSVLTAEAALARLQAGAAAVSESPAAESSIAVESTVVEGSTSENSVSENSAHSPHSATVQTSPSQTLPSQTSPNRTAPEEAVQVRAKPADGTVPEPTPSAPAHDGTPIILGESVPQTAVARPVAPNDSGPDAPWGKIELPMVDVAFTHLPEVPARVIGPALDSGSPSTSAAGPAAPSVSQQDVLESEAGGPNADQAGGGTPAVLQPAVVQLDLTQAGPELSPAGVTITAIRPPAQPEPLSVPAVSPVSAYSNAPPGVAETPQERRKRQNDERRAQAMQDSRAAAERKAAARREQEAAQPAVVQIEFDDLPELPPADSEAPQTVGMRFPASVNVERVPASMRRVPLPPEDSESLQQKSMQEVGRLPARRTQGEPIRIGWAEDDSWRVVKAPGKAAPARRAATAPRWLLPLLAALLLIGGAVWAYYGWSGSKAPAAAAESGPCCTVRFTVQGAAGVTARLTVLEAPDGANLTPGQEVGVAPGPINLPVRGTYRLRVAADGYAPGTLSVTAPTSQPVRIDLGP